MNIFLRKSIRCLPKCLPRINLIRFQSSVSDFIASTPETFAEYDPKLESIIPDLFPSTASSLRDKLQDYNLRKLGHNLKAVSAKVFEDRTALIHAYIHTNEMARAEVLFHRLVLSNNEDIRSYISTPFINAFLEGFLECDVQSQKVERAVEWFDRFEQYNLMPDENSYAIMILYYLSKNDMSNVELYLKKMHDGGIPPKELLTNGRFCDLEEHGTLLALIKRLGYDGEESQLNTADELLLSVLEENNTDTGGIIPYEKTKYNTFNKQEVELLKELEKVEIDATDSIGVSLLRKMLTNMSSKSFSDRKEMQEWLEEEAYAMSLRENEQERTTMPEDVFALSQFPNDLLVKWHKVLVPLIAEEIKSLKRKENSDLVPFLEMLKPEQLSVITISEFVKPPVKYESEVGEHRMTKLVISIGRAAELEHNLHQMKKQKNKKSLLKKDQIHLLHSKGKLFNSQARRLIASASKMELENGSTWKPDWPLKVIVQVGALLAALLVKSATVKVRYAEEDDAAPTATGTNADTFEEPAFWHTKRREGENLYGVIQFNPALLDLMAKHLRLNMDIRMLPMLTPPRPWLTWKSGGYLRHEEKAVRIHGNVHHSRLIQDASNQGKLDEIFKVLDILGLVSWRINIQVLNVAINLWNEGKEVPGIPSRDIPEPEEEPEFGDSEEDLARKRRWMAKQAARLTLIKNLYSQRCAANYQIEVARAFAGQTIYFPHNMDFRGRTYPIPVHLNHIGNDLSRGLMLFDEAKPLGVRGLFWLKVQLSNLAGNDKVSLEDREKWTNNHIDEIMDSADNPLTGRKFWLSTDKPWQFLASAIELVAALRSDNPTEFMSRIHIHQDGTCNGLQHYAALGGDVLGATQVNLVPSPYPQDIYSGIAKLVSERVDKDGEEGHELAKLVRGRISRKIVKQTVMTITYGVTFIGAKNQIHARLKEVKAAAIQAAKERKEQAERTNTQLDETAPIDSFETITDAELIKCSAYLAIKVFHSIGEVFEQSQKIQKWLNTSARLVASSSHVDQLTESERRDSEYLKELGAFTNENVETLDSLPNEDVAVEGQKSSDEGELNGFEDMMKIFQGGFEDELLADMNSDAVLEEITLPKKQLKKMGVDEEDEIPMKNHSVSWTSPLGLPIVQPYRKYKMQSVATFLQSVNVRDKSRPAPVHPQKQSSAFPPNFIHSIDAAHMMQSCLACHEAGITFASVHDSYWTHACDVDTLNEKLRESFVKIHTQNLMQKLKREFEIRCKDHKIPVRIELTPEQAKKWNEYCKNKPKEEGGSAKKSTKISSVIKELELSGAFLGKENISDAIHSAEIKAEESAGKMPRKTVTTKRFVNTWQDLQFPDVPARGSLDINLVLGSQYFFH